MTYQDAALLILGLTCACGRPTVAPLASASDSAGVRLVEYSTEPWAGGARLRLSRVFRVGWQDDEPTFQAEVWPAPGQVRLDGSSVIGDYRGNQVYMISSDGRHIERLGKEGRGPGEYQEIAAVLLVGDTVVVQDDGNWRVTRFAQRQYITQRMPATRCHMIVASRAKGYLAVPYCQPGEANPGWHEVPVEVWDQAGTSIDTLKSVAYFHSSPYGDANPITQQASLGGLPDGGFVYARTDVPAITWHSADGAVRQIVRWPATHEEAADEDWEAYEHWYKDRDYREQAPAVIARQLLEQKKRFRGSMPLFRQVYAADDGSVLLTAFTWDGLPGFADVFNPTGRYAGRVELPKRFVPIDVNGDYIVGWEFDPSDVPAISLYRIMGRPLRNDS